MKRLSPSLAPLIAPEEWALIALGIWIAALVWAAARAARWAARRAGLGGQKKGTQWTKRQLTRT